MNHTYPPTRLDNNLSPRRKRQNATSTISKPRTKNTELESQKGFTRLEVGTITITSLAILLTVTYLLNNETEDQNPRTDLPVREAPEHPKKDFSANTPTTPPSSAKKKAQTPLPEIKTPLTTITEKTVEPPQEYGEDQQKNRALEEEAYIRSQLDGIYDLPKLAEIAFGEGDYDLAIQMLNDYREALATTFPKATALKEISDMQKEMLEKLSSDPLFVGINCEAKKHLGWGRPPSAEDTIYEKITENEQREIELNKAIEEAWNQLRQHHGVIYYDPACDEMEIYENCHLKTKGFPEGFFINESTYRFSFIVSLEAACHKSKMSNEEEK